MRMSWRSAVALLVVIAVGFAGRTAFAQIGFLDAPAMLIALDPAHPGPGQTVRLTLQSPVADLARSSISWSVDGKPLVSDTGATDIAIVAGKLGSETEVTATAQTMTGLARATASIIPAEADLLFDANSYVPPFYQGRALPSPASQLRLHAFARIVRPGAGAVAPEELVYTWRRNSSLLPGISGKGKSSVTLPAPTLFSTDTFAVEAATMDGTIVAAATVRVPSTEPATVFYEDSPLFGIRYRNALTAQSVYSGAELTIAAVPFFALANSPADPRLSYEWSVNGRQVERDEKRPDEITLGAASEGTGRADVRLLLTHTVDLTMESIAKLQVVLSRGGRSTPASETNPFSKTE